MLIYVNTEYPEETFGSGEPVGGKKNWLGMGVLKHLLCSYKSVHVMKVNPTKF